MVRLLVVGALLVSGCTSGLIQRVEKLEAEVKALRTDLARRVAFDSCVDSQRETGATLDAALSECGRRAVEAGWYR